MLIIALVLAVIGLAALVFAVVTANALVAWVCIGASALGVLLLIVDALRERRRGRVPAPDSDTDTDDSDADTDDSDTDADTDTGDAEPDELDETDEPDETAGSGEQADGEPAAAATGSDTVAEGPQTPDAADR